MSINEHRNQAYNDEIKQKTQSSPRIQLIVGLGNPGAEYEKTRHNAGAWFVEAIAKQYRSQFKLDKQFKGQVAKIECGDTICYLLLPMTFMNASGDAIRTVSRFYRISPESILVVHDDSDLPPGTVRLKEGGGDGGHNGLRSTAQQLGSKDFLRLRVGIGHPGHRDRVLDYVLTTPRREEAIEIHAALERALNVLEEIIEGNLQKAMQKLH